MQISAHRTSSAGIYAMRVPVFWILLLLNIVNHALIYLNINVQYLDSDQAFMWAGANDYAAGRFFEPRFYGQNYNTFLEPLISVPFLWSGMPVYYALPLATHLLSMLPFIFPACYLFKRKDISAAIIFLAVPLCLSWPYDILTGIPRGFVTGLAFSTFFILSLRKPHSAALTAFNTAMAVVGYFVNPNSVLIAAPFLFYLFLTGYKSFGYYMATSLAIPVYIICFFLFDFFYVKNPDFVIYDMGLHFSPDYFTENIRHIHERLAHVSFFSGKHAWFLFPAFILLSIALFIFNRKGFFSLLLVPLILVVAFFTNKTADGSAWPFYSYGRSFLGLPLFFALFGSLLPPLRNELKNLLCFFVICFCAIKFSTFGRALHKTLQEENWLGVHLVKVRDARNAIEFYGNLNHAKNSAQLVVSNKFWLNTVLAYGGAAVQSDFPLCFETNNERRFWLREGEKQNIHRNFIYISSLSDLEKQIDCDSFMLIRIDDFGLYEVKDNRLTNEAFIKKVWDAEQEIRRP